MTNATLSPDGKSLTVNLTLTFRKAGRRKRIMVPAGTPACRPEPANFNSALINAVARAHRWKLMLESGEFATLGDLADSEGLNFSYVCRVLRLSLLSPKIIESILDGRQNPALELQSLTKLIPTEWEQQETIFNV